MLKLKPHSLFEEIFNPEAAQIVEVWDKNDFIAAIYNSDPRKIRIITKHPITITGKTEDSILSDTNGIPKGIQIVEIEIGFLDEESDERTMDGD